MFKDHAVEAQPIVNATLNALLEWAPARGRAGADLRSRAGIIKAEAAHLLYNDTIGESMARCFDLAVEVGMSIAQSENVRRVVDTFTTKTVGAGVVKDCMIQLTLVAQANIILNTNFISRQDIDAVQAMINRSFNGVSESVTDRMDSMTNLAIVALHAALSFYLIETARPKPRIMNFQFNQIMTTLTTSYRLYANAGRADEIRYENKVVHPAFALPFGRALAA